MNYHQLHVGTLLSLKQVNGFVLPNREQLSLYYKETFGDLADHNFLQLSRLHPISQNEIFLTQSVVDWLIGVLKDIVEGEHTLSGLCANVYRRQRIDCFWPDCDIVECIRTMSSFWHMLNGNTEYSPIQTASSFAVDREQETLWSGAIGKRRVEFINWLLSILEKKF